MNFKKTFMLPTFLILKIPRKLLWNLTSKNSNLPILLTGYFYVLSFNLPLNLFCF